jgi:hypothetical protein
MDPTDYSLIAALIFALVAIGQLARALMRLPVTVGQTSIPVWASWAAFIAAATLAWPGYRASQG